MGEYKYKVKSAMKINRRGYSIASKGLLCETWIIEGGVDHVGTLKSGWVCEDKQEGQGQGEGVKKRINQEFLAQGSSQTSPGYV